MFLKTIIVLLLIANMIALGSAFYAMMHDMGSKEGSRAMSTLRPASVASRRMRTSAALRCSSTAASCSLSARRLAASSSMA